MRKFFHFKIKSLKQLYLFFFIFSLIVALTISLAIFHWTHPYRLYVMEKTFTNGKKFILYHDFDQDGFSERVEIYSNEIKKKYFLLIMPYYQKTTKIIDQFNFNEPLNPRWIFFGDYTGDGYDEMIVFTQKKDSLYLSIIDVNLKKWILRRHYLLSVQKPNPYHDWDIVNLLCHLLDVNEDGKPDVVFAIHSGFSLHPRGVFIFDVSHRQIINRFQFDAGISDFILYDLTGDDKPEIIVSGHASGNIHKPSKYTDFKAWLFVLDQQLNFVFPPRCFGEYPSVIYCNPLEMNGDKYLLISYNYAGDKLLPGYIFLMNANGKIIRKQTLTVWNIVPPLISKIKHRPVIYVPDANGKIFKLNADLKIEKEMKLKTTGLVILDLIDLNRDGQAEIICSSSNGLLILTQELKPIARFPMETYPDMRYSRRYNGPEGPIAFAVNVPQNTYLFSLEKNYLYAYLPYVFIGLSGFIFFILLLFHRLMTIINIYAAYFLFSLRKSRQGLLILDYKGKIFYFNGRMQELLHLSEPILKKQHFTTIFKERPSIANCIQKAIDLQKPYQCDLNFQQAHNQIKGEMAVTPFRTSFNFVYAYLIEFFDHTQLILSDRLKVWSRSVQKMAHDIKQPLSSISLNLKTLQMRLEKIDISGQKEIRDDIQMMQTEMENVRQITNKFLKFVNLDTPKFQWIDLQETIRNSTNRFKPLLDENLQIEFEFDSEITSIWADPRQLEIVLHTIIENAIDAMKGKGHIRISSALIQDLENFDKQFIQIEIADSGPGIDASIKDNIFEPFFTTKMDGTGMGLALAKKIVEDHGGNIIIYSKEKIGTVVKILFPQMKS